MLVIEDLSISDELDRKAMADTLGGSWTYSPIYSGQWKKRKSWYRKGYDLVLNGKTYKGLQYFEGLQRQQVQYRHRSYWQPGR